eukprot:gene8098-1846_t
MKRESDAADTEARFGNSLEEKRERMYHAREREKLIKARKEARQGTERAAAQDPRTLRITQLNCNSIAGAMAAEVNKGIKEHKPHAVVLIESKLGE